MPVSAVFPHASAALGDVRVLLPARRLAARAGGGLDPLHRAQAHPAQPARGSLWCTVFDARPGRPFQHKLTTEELGVPEGGWISIGEAQLTPRARGGSLRRGALVAALRLLGARAAPPAARVDVPRAAAAHEAHEPRARGELRWHDRAARPHLRIDANDRAARLARDGGPQLGRGARRALDLAARRRLRGGPRRVAGRGDRPRARRAVDDTVGGQRRALHRRTAASRWAGWARAGLLVAETPRALPALAAGAGWNDRRCAHRHPSRDAARAGATPTPTAASTTSATARSPHSPSTVRQPGSSRAHPAHRHTEPLMSWGCASTTTACRSRRSPTARGLSRKGRTSGCGRWPSRGFVLGLDLAPPSLRPCVRASLDPRPPQPHIPSGIGPVRKPGRSPRPSRPPARARSCRAREARREGSSARRARALASAVGRSQVASAGSGKRQLGRAVVSTPPSVENASPQISVRSRVSSSAIWPGVWPGGRNDLQRADALAGRHGARGDGLRARVAALERALRLAGLERAILVQQAGLALCRRSPRRRAARRRARRASRCGLCGRASARCARSACPCGRPFGGSSWRCAAASCRPA